MRILTVGPGAVGGYFGGRLAHGGADVTFAARGRTLETLRSEGLAVKSVDGDFDVRPVRAASLEELEGPFDLLLVCVKNYQLDPVLDALPGLCGERTAVVSLLNGLGSEERLAAVVGAGRTYGGVAFIGSRVEGPGRIVHSAAGRLKVGALDGREAPVLDEFRALCEKAHVHCRVSGDIVRDIWVKLVWNASFNAVTALGRATVAEALACEESLEAMRAVMAEVIRVGRACGISLDDSLIEQTIEGSRGLGEVRTSMLVDVEEGRRLEGDAINGAVAARGKEMGVDAPVNRALHGLLKLLDEKAARDARGR